MKVSFDIALDDQGIVELSDDGFEVAGFIDLTVAIFNPEDVDGNVTAKESVTVEVHVDELHRACMPFLDRWYREREELRG